jgi:hypothetical protein
LIRRTVRSARSEASSRALASDEIDWPFGSAISWGSSAAPGLKKPVR